MPNPTPPKCAGCTFSLARRAAWPSTIDEVKIIAKALASPARKRMTTKAGTVSKNAMASSSTALASSARTATVRSRLDAQP